MDKFGMDKKELEDVQIQGISFRPDGLVELVYTEAREATESGQIFRTAVFEYKLCEQTLTEIEADLRDLVDEMATAIRNPPKRLRPAPDDEDDE